MPFSCMLKKNINLFLRFFSFSIFFYHDFAGIPFVFVVITFSASFDGYGTDRRFAAHLMMIKLKQTLLRLFCDKN